MQPLHSYHQEGGGWPRWVLFAAVPLVLALGLISGMAVATYTARPQTPVAETPDPSAQPADPGQPPPVVSNRPDSSWQIVPTPGTGTTGPVRTVPPVYDVDPRPIPGSGPQAVPTNPSQAYYQGTPRDARDARTALSLEFASFSADGITVSFDYQQMKQAGGGNSLVGIARVSGYPNWETALRQNPEKLTRWLQAAAARVQEAAKGERFFLSWAVVDVVSDRPSGFATHEITPLDNGTFLVIRPLAATSDYAKTDIALRPVSSLTETNTSAPSVVREPWAVYGPVLRFDRTDIYRPPGASTARPTTR